MQILRLLAARRFRRRRRAAVSTITATAPVTPRGGFGAFGYGDEEDDGPFFDLDLSCCSAPASSAGSQAAESGSESDDYHPSTTSSAKRGADDDFVISLHRSRSASPSYEDRRLFSSRRGAAAAAARTTPPPPPPPAAHFLFCASEPSDAASRARCSGGGASRRGGRLQLRTLSFGSAKAAFYGVGGRASFSRSASSSARSSASRLFAAYASSSPDRPDLHLHDGARARPTSGGDVFRRYLSKISSRLRRVAPAVAGDLRLRKSRSASFPAQPASAAQSSSSPPPPPRRDDSLVEKQDGIASAIAHCKESLHRASVSELDTSLLRSQSDPGL